MIAVTAVDATWGFLAVCLGFRLRIAPAVDLYLEVRQHRRHLTAARTACSGRRRLAAAVQAGPAPRAAAGPALRRCHTPARGPSGSRRLAARRSEGPPLGEAPGEAARPRPSAGQQVTVATGAFLAFLRLQLEVFRPDPTAALEDHRLLEHGFELADVARARGDPRGGPSPAA